MSEQEKPQITAEEQLKEIQKKTSFGSYFNERMRKLAIAAIGFAVGFVTFLALDKVLVKNGKYKKHADNLLDRSNSLNPYKTDDTIDSLPFLGGIIGFFASQFFNSYDNWKKRETENIAVEKINNDVARMMDERHKFAETLDRQDTVIKEILEQRQAGTAMPHADKAAAKTTEPVMR